MPKKARKTDDILVDIEAALKEHGDLLERNNKLLESINDYVRKIAVNTS